MGSVSYGVRGEGEGDRRADGDVTTSMRQNVNAAFRHE